MSRSNLPPPIIHTDEELLELYLSLSERERLQRFVGTAQAAKITGLSVQTVFFRSPGKTAMSVGFPAVALREPMRRGSPVMGSKLTIPQPEL